MNDTKDLLALARKNAAGLDAGELLREGFLPRDGGYFPALFYPPQTMYPPMDEDVFFGGGGVAGPVAVYAHIPFCLSKCEFCHFVTSAGSSDGEKDLYLSALEKEMDVFMARLGLKSLPARSISVGGGTPTCLTPAQLGRFLEFFTRRLSPEPGAQFIFDADPTTLLGAEGLERLKLLRSFGVSRLTIGAQCFHDRTLKRMGRAHTSSDIALAVGQARAAGFESLCLDLIYGYPGQTAQEWGETVGAAIGLGVESFQIYRLRIVPHGYMPGQITAEYRGGGAAFPPHSEVLVMKEFSGLLAEGSGYSDAASTCVFAKAEKELGVYNADRLKKRLDLLGFGIGAFSALNGRVGVKAFKTPADYYSLVSRGRTPIEFGKIKTRGDELRGCVAGPLKNSREVLKKDYLAKTGERLEEVFAGKIGAMERFGLLRSDGEKISLTRRGGFFADEAAIQFYGPEYIPFPETAYAGGALNPYRQQPGLRKAG